MEINNYKFSSTNSWELELAMEDQIILHHQNKLPLPATTLWPTNPYPLHQDHHQIPSSSLIQLPSSSDHYGHRNNINQTQTDQARQAADDQEEELGAMKEMTFKIAAMQPIDIDPSTIRKPKRRNVRISDDPQSVAARHRREKISEKIRILQRLVPGGTKMDTASMLEEAGLYIKFLKRQIRQLEDTHQSHCNIGVMSNFAVPVTNKPHLGCSTGSFSMEPVTYQMSSNVTNPVPAREHV